MRAGRFARAAMVLAGISIVPGGARSASAVGERVSVTACPYAGVTAPCLMIKGADGTVYNITGANPKPPLNGRMIRLRATVTDKLSACTRGMVLDRIHWTPVRRKCPN